MSELAARHNARSNAEQSLVNKLPSQNTTNPADVSACDDELAQARKEIASLKRALHTRTVIGQATGLLMAKLNGTPDEAFAELVKMSSHTNQKLRHVAAEVVSVFGAYCERDRVRSTQLDAALQSLRLPLLDTKPRVRDRAQIHHLRT